MDSSTILDFHQADPQRPFYFFFLLLWSLLQGLLGLAVAYGCLYGLLWLDDVYRWSLTYTETLGVLTPLSNFSGGVENFWGMTLIGFLGFPAVAYILIMSSMLRRLRFYPKRWQVLADEWPLAEPMYQREHLSLSVRILFYPAILIISSLLSGIVVVFIKGSQFNWWLDRLMYSYLPLFKASPDIGLPVCQLYWISFLLWAWWYTTRWMAARDKLFLKT